jgi:regulator of replication initiation timing
MNKKNKSWVFNQDSSGQITGIKKINSNKQVEELQEQIGQLKAEMENLSKIAGHFRANEAKALVDIVKLKSENEMLKEALMKIYTLNIPAEKITDTHFHTVVALRTIAEQALKTE